MGKRLRGRKAYPFGMWDSKPGMLPVSSIRAEDTILNKVCNGIF